MGDQPLEVPASKMGPDLQLMPWTEVNKFFSVNTTK